MGQTCSQATNGTNNTPPNYPSYPAFNNTLACYDTDGAYNSTAQWYSGGSNGICNIATKTDNCIDTFNQYGSIVRSPVSGCNSTVGAGSAVAPNASCTVEGRYATIDDAGPSIVIGGSAAGLFDTDADNWCNMTKYVAVGYGTSASTLAGCEYYRNKIVPTPIASDKHPDLLKGLEITVDDVSGVSEIKVEIGKCSATYGLADGLLTAIADIAKNPSSPDGVKESYRNIVLHYNTTSTN